MRARDGRAAPIDVLLIEGRLSRRLRVVRRGAQLPSVCVRGLRKAEAEELLDWLEGHGAAGELHYETGQGFTVRSPRQER
jgi:hypothetical protein